MASQELFVTTLLNSTYLKGYYRLESDGTDSSTSGFTLTTSGSPTFSAGKFGNGVSTTTSKYLYRNSTTDLDVTTGAFSLGCWIKTTKADTTESTIIGKQESGPSYFGYFIRMCNGGGSDAGKIYGTIFSSDGVDDIVSSSAYNDGNWHFVVFTRPSSGGTIKLYVDGSSVATATNNNRNATSNSKFSIGTRNAYADSKVFTGSIDDAFVFIGYELSSTEIAGLYNGTLSLRTNNWFMFF